MPSRKRGIQLWIERDQLKTAEAQRDEEERTGARSSFQPRSRGGGHHSGLDRGHQMREDFYY